MSNQNQSPEEFDLFAPNTEDDLHEVLAKGSYKWTNKYTAIFAIALVVVTSASAGIWYGHRSTSTNSAFGAASAFNRSARTGFGGFGASASASATGALPGMSLRRVQREFRQELFPILVHPWQRLLYMPKLY